MCEWKLWWGEASQSNQNILLQIIAWFEPNEIGTALLQLPCAFSSLISNTCHIPKFLSSIYSKFKGQCQIGLHLHVAFCLYLIHTLMGLQNEAAYAGHRWWAKGQCRHLIFKYHPFTNFIESWNIAAYTKICCVTVCPDGLGCLCWNCVAFLGLLQIYFLVEWYHRLPYTQ